MTDLGFLMGIMLSSLSLEGRLDGIACLGYTVQLNQFCKPLREPECVHTLGVQHERLKNSSKFYQVPTKYQIQCEAVYIL